MQGHDRIATRGSGQTMATVSDQGVVRGSIVLALVSLAGFGFLYSLAGVGVGQVLFPAAANGSLVEDQGRIAGSSLVAQPFPGDRYFRPRPSVAGYNPMAMSGSNQARTNPALRAQLTQARAAVAGREGVAPEQVPGDLITHSGSGIDPHISPQAAAIQVARIARARGVGEEAVAGLVARYSKGPQFGVFGRPRVNVLELNLALDRQLPPVAAAGAGR